METESSGREGLPCKLASTLIAAGQGDPTSAVTRSSDVSRLEITTSMVLIGHSRGEAEVSPQFR